MFNNPKKLTDEELEDILLNNRLNLNNNDIGTYEAYAFKNKNGSIKEINLYNYNDSYDVNKYYIIDRLKYFLYNGNFYLSDNEDD